jgi:hypothetical protein
MDTLTTTPFTVRQSDLKTFGKCPLMYRYQKIDQIPRTQSASLTFGTIIHACVLYMETTEDATGAITRFQDMWADPEKYDEELEQNGQTLKIDYYVRGTSFKKYASEGERILKAWWHLISWESDHVLAREYPFTVPIGNGHTFTGTIDKLALRYMPKVPGRRSVLVSDYKTTRKEPTYDWLNDDLQFTAYAYATTQPEFWAGIPNGEVLYAELADAPRWGEWVQLMGPKRKDAGERLPHHYNRLTIAVNELARSVEAGIFVPNISGESCRWCEFRDNCGLPEIPTD